MDSDKLNDWLQVIAAGGIIASLIFVGIQLKQSQDIAIAAQYQSRYESAVETSRANLQSDTVLTWIGNGVAGNIQADPETSDEIKAWALDQPVEELAVLLLSSQINLKTLDNLYFQYQSGFLSDEAWLVFRAELKSQFALGPPASIIRILYEANPEYLRASFRIFLDEMAAEVDAELERKLE